MKVCRSLSSTHTSTLTHTHTLAHAYTHIHTPKLTNTYQYALMNTHTQQHTLTHQHAHCHMLTHTCTQSQTPSHMSPFSHSPTLTGPPKHIHTLSLTHFQQTHYIHSHTYNPLHTLRCAMYSGYSLDTCTHTQQNTLTQVHPYTFSLIHSHILTQTYTGHTQVCMLFPNLYF